MGDAPTEVEGALASLGESIREREGATGGYDLSEEAHRTAIEEAESAATDWVLDPQSLVADARDCLLEQIKRRPKPWSVLSPGEQRDVAAACEHAAQELVRKVVEEVAARGQKAVRVFLQKVTIADEIQIVGKVKTLTAVEEDEAVTMLHHARGGNVMLTVASKDDYQTNHREAETDVEEPLLTFEAGGDAITDEDLAGEDEAERPELEPEGGRRINEPSDYLTTGDLVHIDQHGPCEIRVNIKTGMVEARMNLDDQFSIDVREASPAELAAERERTADFESGGEDQARQTIDA